MYLTPSPPRKWMNRRMIRSPGEILRLGVAAAARRWFRLKSTSLLVGLSLFVAAGLIWWLGSDSDDLSPGDKFTRYLRTRPGDVHQLEHERDPAAWFDLAKDVLEDFYECMEKAGLHDDVLLELLADIFRQSEASRGDGWHLIESIRSEKLIAQLVFIPKAGIVRRHSHDGDLVALIVIEGPAEIVSWTAMQTHLEGKAKVEIVRKGSVRDAGITSEAHEIRAGESPVVLAELIVLDS